MSGEFEIESGVLRKYRGNKAHLDIPDGNSSPISRDSTMPSSSNVDLVEPSRPGFFARLFGKASHSD